MYSLQLSNIPNSAATCTTTNDPCVGQIDQYSTGRRLAHTQQPNPPIPMRKANVSVCGVTAYIQHIIERRLREMDNHERKSEYTTAGEGFPISRGQQTLSTRKLSAPMSSMPQDRKTSVQPARPKHPLNISGRLCQRTQKQQPVMEPSTLCVLERHDTSMEATCWSGAARFKTAHDGTEVARYRGRQAFCLNAKYALEPSRQENTATLPHLVAFPNRTLTHDSGRSHRYITDKQL